MVKVNNRIEFRAFDIPNKVWIPIGCIEFFEGGGITINEEIPVHVNDIVITQSTGLKNKKGETIFEGDIVKYKSQNCGYVVWSGHNYHNDWHHYGQHYTYGWYIKRKYYSGHRLDSLHPSAKIIGNVFEDPELIK